MPQCSVCSYDNPENARFCNQCGQVIPVTSAPETQPISPPATSVHLDATTVSNTARDSSINRSSEKRKKLDPQLQAVIGVVVGLVVLWIIVSLKSSSNDSSYPKSYDEAVARSPSASTSSQPSSAPSQPTTRAPATPTPDVSNDEIELARVKEKLRRDYPNDYVTQQGVYEMQVEAYRYMKNIPDSKIKSKLQRDYPHEVAPQLSVVIDTTSQLTLWWRLTRRLDASAAATSTVPPDNSVIL